MIKPIFKKKLYDAIIQVEPRYVFFFILDVTWDLETLSINPMKT